MTAAPLSSRLPDTGRVVMTTDLKASPSTASVKPKSLMPSTYTSPLATFTDSSAPEGASLTGVTSIERSRMNVLPVLSVPSTRTLSSPLKFGSWEASTVKVSLSTAVK